MSDIDLQQLQVPNFLTHESEVVLLENVTESEDDVRISASNCAEYCSCDICLPVL